MPNPKTIDAAAFERAFQQALPGYEKSVRNSLSEAGMASLMTTSEIKETFCTAWPKIESAMSLVIKGLKWWNPAAAVLVKGFMTAVKSTLLPVVCPVTTPPAE